MELDLNILLHLLIALVLAGLLGWERERTGKAAGIRTHMLVGMLIGLERFLLATAAAVLVFCVLHIVAYVTPADTKEDKGTE